jgi:hypothetical protein
MTPAAFRRLALSSPEAHEEPHFERTSRGSLSSNFRGNKLRRARQSP